MLVGLLSLLAACTGGRDATTDAVATSSAAAVASVDEVASAQADADGRLQEVLAELRAGDETVRRLRAAASASSALDASATVRGSLQGLDLEAVDAAFDRLGRATAEAREAVADATTAAGTADDGWVVAYLDAESRVLDAVAEHADAGRDLVAAARPHRDALDEVLAVADTIDVPDDGEAVAAAIELEVGDDLEALIAAQQATVTATERRAATATALNAASADAAAVAERRPAS